MDGVQPTIKGTNYPAPICVAGWSDLQVLTWQPGKSSAAMQNASTSNIPLLMKENYDNGHFTEDRDVTYVEFATPTTDQTIQQETEHPARKTKGTERKDESDQR